MQAQVVLFMSALAAVLNTAGLVWRSVKEIAASIERPGKLSFAPDAVILCRIAMHRTIDKWQNPEEALTLISHGINPS